MAKLLITGGAGFIGSHTCLVLLDAGHDLVVLDNFSNSCPESLNRVSQLANLGSDSARLQVVEGDIRSKSDLRKSFQTGQCIDAVIHFAGLKAVGDSIHQPLSYWHVNVEGTRCLLEAMRRHACRTRIRASRTPPRARPPGVIHTRLSDGGLLSTWSTHE